jgi:hypothetical protein
MIHDAFTEIKSSSLGLVADLDIIVIKIAVKPHLFRVRI